VTHQVKQTQHIPFRQSFDILQLFLQAMYEDIVTHPDPKFQVLVVCKAVTVSYRPPDRVLLSWMSSPSSDMVADSVAAVLLQANLGVSGMKGMWHSHSDAVASWLTLPWPVFSCLMPCSCDEEVFTWSFAPAR